MLVCTTQETHLALDSPRQVLCCGHTILCVSVAMALQMVRIIQQYLSSPTLCGARHQMWTSHLHCMYAFQKPNQCVIVGMFSGLRHRYTTSTPWVCTHACHVTVQCIHKEHTLRYTHVDQTLPHTKHTLPLHGYSMSYSECHAGYKISDEADLLLTGSMQHVL